MKITMQMLDAAIRKAVEAGLLPRDALREESCGDRELIRHVVEAALDAGKPRRSNDAPTHAMPT